MKSLTNTPETTQLLQKWSSKKIKVMNNSKRILTLELNHMFESKQIDITCAPQPHTECGTLSPFPNERQDNNYSQNPFFEPNKSVEPLTEFNNKNTNPFINGNKMTNFDRSLSCDNLSFIMPTIPPLIRRCSIPSPELLPFRSNKNFISSDFMGNPFNSLKLYRNQMFYSMPTQSIPIHLNHNHYQLPPTPLFPNQNVNTIKPFLRTLSQNKVNTNPFLEKSPESVSSSSSMDSVIGIESSDSSDSSDCSDCSDDTITSYKSVSNNTVCPVNDIVVIDLNTSHKNNENINSNKNKNESKNSPKFYVNGNFKIHKSLDPNKLNLESAKNGDGMVVMHESINTNCFGSY